VTSSRSGEQATCILGLHTHHTTRTSMINLENGPPLIVGWRFEATKTAHRLRAAYIDSCRASVTETLLWADMGICPFHTHIFGSVVVGVVAGYFCAHTNPTPSYVVQRSILRDVLQTSETLAEEDPALGPLAASRHSVEAMWWPHSTSHSLNMAPMRGALDLAESLQQG
jgi:hypothetical protein